MSKIYYLAPRLLCAVVGIHKIRNFPKLIRTEQLRHFTYKQRGVIPTDHSGARFFKNFIGGLVVHRLTLAAQGGNIRHTHFGIFTQSFLQCFKVIFRTRFFIPHLISAARPIPQCPFGRQYRFAGKLGIHTYIFRRGAKEEIRVPFRAFKFQKHFIGIGFSYIRLAVVKRVKKHHISCGAVKNRHIFISRNALAPAVGIPQRKLRAPVVKGIKALPKAVYALILCKETAVCRFTQTFPVISEHYLRTLD